MNIRHLARNGLLIAAYAHPAAASVLARRGVRGVRDYLSAQYRCSKTDGGSYLPVVPVDELAASDVDLRVVRPHNWGGSLTITEISSLCMLVAALKPRTILEIGTFRGV